ncbi:MAG: deoxyribodipyrimidine photo-lyase [Phycisphaeraceae bacterium]|nr:MAG: deoxyribodipyrimidine photo-lyase [Phycisphaeraceae bacterium]
MPTLMWFRSDLRVADNTALWHVCREATRESDGMGGVVAVYTITPDQWAAHDMAPVKVDLILRTLGELSTELGALNIPLRILTVPGFNDVPGALLKLCREVGARAVYLNKEYEINEIRRDEAVAEMLADEEISTHAFDDQTVVPPGALRTGEGRWYTVFTPFKKSWIKKLEAEGIPEVLGKPRRQLPLKIRPDDVPDRVRGFEPWPRPEFWPAGEKAAMKRLSRFVEKSIAAYKDQRDFPGIDGTSTLSHHLSIGSVSPRQCLHAALEANSGKLDGPSSGATHWISELVWREFYRHLLAAYPRLCMGRAFKPETERLRWRDDSEGFDAWREGRTGVPLVDAAMRSLLHTGWMHNRLRMVVAMYLTKDLLIDWHLGERHFMRHLVDGDLAQNNGGWQWSASTGTDAAPYFRIFNPISQSRKFDPDGAFIRRWVPELADLDNETIHDPSELPLLLRSTLKYPEPIVDRAIVKDRVLAAFQAIKA